MIRIPHVFIPNVRLAHKNQTVNRLVIAHPKSVQYIQHNPETSEFCIRYVSGEEMCIQNKEDPESMKKIFNDLVFQIKDTSDS